MAELSVVRVTDFDGRDCWPPNPKTSGGCSCSGRNDGDVDGVAALYEPDAVVASADGDLVSGAEAIRRMYETLLADPPQFAGDVRPALRRGDLALTSTRFRGSATAEISRRQGDGTWLWVADQPNVTG